MLRCLLYLPFLAISQSFAPVKHYNHNVAVKMSEAPSDYDSFDLTSGPKAVAVDTDADDAFLRDALKRELLLMASVTNRGEYASADERDIVIDLVTQLEALNPTPDPALASSGEWDLVLSSTQFFRSSPFFQSIRRALGNSNKEIAFNGFDIHDAATTASRVGRIRQTVSDTQLVSEVDLEVGILPGFPFRVKGTVLSAASLKIVPPETWELQMTTTQVKGSNIPLLNQIMDDIRFELPVGELYRTFGNVPIVPLKTYYVDEGIRITRDEDDNFFVFSRA